MIDVQTEVLIVGAGPAGSAAATFLAREGVDVLVIDRATFPREKVCGDGLTPRAVSMLRTLGLEARLTDMGFRQVHEYRATSTRGHIIRTAIPSFGGGPRYAYVVPRKELDLLLVETARAAGAVVKEGTRALYVERASTERASMERAVAEGLSVVAREPGGETARLRARVVLAADGSAGSFSRSIAPTPRHGPPAIAIRAYMEGVSEIDGALNFYLNHRLLPGYGWIFPDGKGGDAANVGVMVHAETLRRLRCGLRDLFDEFLSCESLAWPHLREASLLTRPSASALRMDFLSKRRRDGSLLFLGDAAGLINPLSGEGLGYALESGRAAATVTAQALRSGRPSDLAEYEVLVRRACFVEFTGARLVREALAQPWRNGLGNEIVARLVTRGGPLSAGVSRGFLKLLS